MRPKIGYIYFARADNLDSDVLYQILLRKTDVVPIAYEDQLDFDDVKKKVAGCAVVVNYAVGEPVTLEALELTKSIEELGIKVINSSHSFYYQEDKWMFYLKCLEHKLPTPKSYLMPKEGHNEKKIKDMLSNSPLVIKAIYSDNGLCVEKADDYPEFRKKLNKIIDKNPVSPIIAQEFLENDGTSYRATVVGHKIEQFIEKAGKRWKQTGHYKTEKFRMLRPGNNLRLLCERASRAFGMEICGLDLIKNGQKYYIIEANSCPGLNIIDEEEAKVSMKIADYVIGLCQNHR